MLTYGFGQVDPYQQKTNYTCSAASLLAVLKHYEINGWTEETLSDLIGTTPNNGASSNQVVNAARRLGFTAVERRFDTIAQAKEFTDRGIPIIALVHSFIRPGGWHFVVITDVSPSLVTMMDPNVSGNVRVLSYPEMLARWSTWQGYRFGIVVAR